jgi:hypothetical protein
VAGVESYYKQFRRLKDAYECILKNCLSLSNPNSLPLQTMLIVSTMKLSFEISIIDIYSKLVELETLEYETKRIYYDVLIIRALQTALVIIIALLIGSFVLPIATPFNIIILILVILGFLILIVFFSLSVRLISKIFAKRKVEKDVVFLINLSMKILRDLSYFCNRSPYHCLPTP